MNRRLLDYMPEVLPHALPGARSAGSELREEGEEMEYGAAHLAQGRHELQRTVEGYLAWLRGPAARSLRQPEGTPLPALQ